MANKNGMAKNLEVVQMEIANWRALMPIHIKSYREAKSLGRKVHKAWNLVTETIRLMPRTVGYSALILLLLDGLLHLFLWFR